MDLDASIGRLLLDSTEYLRLVAPLPSGAVEEDATSIDVVSHVDHFLREDLEMPLERLAGKHLFRGWRVPPDS